MSMVLGKVTKMGLQIKKSCKIDGLTNLITLANMIFWEKRFAGDLDKFWVTTLVRLPSSILHFPNLVDEF